MLLFRFCCCNFSRRTETATAQKAENSYSQQTKTDVAAISGIRARFRDCAFPASLILRFSAEPCSQFAGL
jgi:hypothetical protein